MTASVLIAAMILCSTGGTSHAQVNNLAANQTSDFGFRLASAELDADSNGNVLVSPLSAQMALSMLALGARGNTLSQIRLLLPKSDELEQALGGIASEGPEPKLQVHNKVRVHLANSIWIDKSFAVDRGFVVQNQDKFNADVRQVNLRDDSLVGEVNKWVSDHTEHKIPKVIDRFDPSEVMVLINALHFMGPWASQFDPSDTANRPFINAIGAKVSVPTMEGKSKPSRLIDCEGYAAMSMPFYRGRFAMIIYLPDKGVSIKQLLGILEKTNLKALEKEMQVVQGKIQMPKWKQGFSFDLGGTLRQMGMTDAFSLKADFRGISENGGMMVGRAVQQTAITVDEAGAEASAATSLGMIRGVLPRKDFIVDRPFVYTITDQARGINYFIGVMNDPSKQ